MDYEEAIKKRNQAVFVPNWFSVDIKTGVSHSRNVHGPNCIIPRHSEALPPKNSDHGYAVGSVSATPRVRLSFPRRVFSPWRGGGRGGTHFPEQRLVFEPS